jgi:hypothetical protein
MRGKQVRHTYRGSCGGKLPSSPQPRVGKTTKSYNRPLLATTESYPSALLASTRSECRYGLETAVFDMPHVFGQPRME